MAKASPGVALPESALEPYTCEVLGLTLAELRAMTREEIEVHLAWHEGRWIAEWASANPPKRGGARSG